MKVYDPKQAKDEMNAGIPTGTEDLVFWKLIVKRWYIVLFMVMLGSGLVIAKHKLSAPEYESKVFLRIGNLPGDWGGYLESQQSLITRLIVTHEVDGQHDGVAYVSAVNAVSVKDGAKDVVAITTRGTDPSAVKNLMKRIVDEILKDHAKRAQMLRKELMVQQQIMSRQIAALSALTENMPDIDQAMTAGDSAAMALVDMRRMEAIKGLAVAMDAHSKLNTWLKNEDIWKTLMIKDASEPPVEVGRPILRELVATFILAVFASMLVIAMQGYRTNAGRPR